MGFRDTLFQCLRCLHPLEHLERLRVTARCTCGPGNGEFCATAGMMGDAGRRWKPTLAASNGLVLRLSNLADDSRRDTCSLRGSSFIPPGAPLSRPSSIPGATPENGPLPPVTGGATWTVDVVYMRRTCASASLQLLADGARCGQQHRHLAARQLCEIGRTRSQALFSLSPSGCAFLWKACVLTTSTGAAGRSRGWTYLWRIG